MRARSTASVAALGAIAIACAPGVVGGAEIALRPDDPRAPTPHFDEGDVVERFVSPRDRFAIHFARAGRHAVPPADDDASGVPDFVEDVARSYDASLAFFDARGLRTPLSDLGAPEGDGGDDRFDVYLVDFGGGADGAFRRDVCGLGAGGACSGHMVVENDFAGYSFASRDHAIRILASHELFHAVQAAYDGDQSAVLGEGTAVWASEQLDPELDDLERFSGAYLGATERSIEQSATGPVDPFTYGSAVFFQFLSERYGADLVRGLLEDTEDGAQGIADPRWLDALDARLAREHDTTFEEAWIEHARWNLRTGSLADPSVSYAHGAELSELGRTEVELPFADDRARMLRASSRSYEASFGARGAVGIELVAPPERARAIEGLWLLATPRDGSALGETAARRAIDGALIVERGSATAIIVTIVRARDDDAGEGRVPAVCIGSPAELDACRTSFAGAVDAGVDAHLESDAGTAAPTPPTAGCGCSIARAGGGPGLVLGVVLIAWARRRR